MEFNFVRSLGPARIPSTTRVGGHPYPGSGGSSPQGWTVQWLLGFATQIQTANRGTAAHRSPPSDSPQTHASPQVRLTAWALKCQLKRMSGLEGRNPRSPGPIISPDSLLLSSFLWQSPSSELTLKVAANPLFERQSIGHSLRGSGRISGTAWPRRRWYRTGALRCVNSETLQTPSLRPLY